MRVRTGRFTTREHMTSSHVAVGLHPPVSDGEQTRVRKPRLRHPGWCRQGLGQVPVALATERREDCLTFARPRYQPVAHAGVARSAPPRLQGPWLGEMEPRPPIPLTTPATLPSPGSRSATASSSATKLSRRHAPHAISPHKCWKCCRSLPRNRAT